MGKIRREGTASAKALRQECARLVQKIARRPVWLRWSEAEGQWEKVDRWQEIGPSRVFWRQQGPWLFSRGPWTSLGGGSELRRGVIRSPWLPSAVWLVGAEEEAGRPAMVQGAMVVACFKVGRVRPAQTLDLC